MCCRSVYLQCICMARWRNNTLPIKGALIIQLVNVDRIKHGFTLQNRRRNAYRAMQKHNNSQVLIKVAFPCNTHNLGKKTNHSQKMLQSSNMLETSVPSEHHGPSHGTRDFTACGILLRQFQYFRYSTILALRVYHFALSNRPWLLSLSLQRSLASTLLSYTAVMIADVILRHFMEFEDSFERILKDLRCNAGNVCRRIS